MRKPNAREGVRSRRYRRLQFLRGVVLAIAVGVAFAIVASLLLLRTEPERITLNDWASTRAFSGQFDAKELKEAYKASHSAYMHYIRRELVQVDHSKIDKAFEGVRNEAELVSALSELNRLSEDPHARLWTQSEYDHFFAVMNGKNVGVELGFSFDWQTNRWKVSNCPPESSAARAGIAVGDELVSIGPNSVHVFGTGWQAQEPIMRTLNNGLLGSTVEVVVRRGDDFISADVERIVTGSVPSLTSEVPWDPFQSQQLNNARVIRLVTLYHPELVQALETELAAAEKAGVKGLVLNLTEGFGGDPESGMRVAAMFMEKGVISHRITVTKEGALEMRSWEVKDGKVLLTIKGPFALKADGSIDTANPQQPEKTETLDWKVGLFKGQVVMSISNFTQGAGEIIVGALKDPSRFVVCGSTWTGGKGSGQSYYHVGAGYVLRLSTAFYLLPEGGPIEGVGIEPDRAVHPQADPTSFATFVLADRLQVVAAPVLPPEPEKQPPVAPPVEAPKPEGK